MEAVFKRLEYTVQGGLCAHGHTFVDIKYVPVIDWVGLGQTLSKDTDTHGRTY